jgi:hypothetical protein
VSDDLAQEWRKVGAIRALLVEGVKHGNPIRISLHGRATTITVYHTSGPRSGTTARRPRVGEPVFLVNRHSISSLLYLSSVPECPHLVETPDKARENHDCYCPRILLPTAQFTYNKRKVRQDGCLLTCAGQRVSDRCNLSKPSGAIVQRQMIVL